MRNSVPASFAAPAPVVPPIAIYRNPSGPKWREFGAWFAIARGRPVTISSSLEYDGPFNIATRPELASPDPCEILERDNSKCTAVLVEVLSVVMPRHKASVSKTDG